MGGLPHFDRRRLRGALCDGLFCRKIRNRIIRREAACISMELRLLSPNFFLSMCQLFHLMDRPLCGRPGAGLGTISLSSLPPPALGGVPELALQLFRACEKAAPKEFLRRGLNLFFCFFGNRLFFFYFCDTSSPLLHFSMLCGKLLKKGDALCQIQ